MKFLGDISNTKLRFGYVTNHTKFGKSYGGSVAVIPGIQRQ